MENNQAQRTQGLLTGKTTKWKNPELEATEDIKHYKTLRVTKRSYNRLSDSTH